MRLLADRPHAVSDAFAALAIGEKELHKHTMIEVLPFRLDHYLKTGDIDRSAEQLLIVHYPPDAAARAQYFTMNVKKSAV